MRKVLASTVRKIRFKSAIEEKKMKFINRMGAFCGAATLVLTLAGISNSASAAELELVEENT